MSVSALGDQNPWWKDRALVGDDTLIVAWERSSFKWLPRIVKTFNWNVKVIYSLRGPRQVGKTTLLKLVIRDLLEKGVDARRIFYWSCDQLESFEKLSETIVAYVDWARKFSSEMLYLFLDEVSWVKDWQRAIKYLYDTGKLRNCLVVLTGSHSIDLAKATESLAGRRGEVEKLGDKFPDKILLGAKFSEYAETRDKGIRDALGALGLLSAQRRLKVLLDLASGKMPDSLAEFKLYQKDLNVLLGDYLLTGGIPRAVDSYISKGTISEIVYGDYVNLILRDIANWGGNEVFLRQIIQRIVQTLSTQVSWNALKDGTEISTHDTVRWYVSILANSFVVSYLHELNRDNGLPYYRKAKKIYFQDPFIFHSLRAWAFGLTQPFSEAMSFLKNPENKSKLMESVVCDHLIRLLFNVEPRIGFDYATELFYWESAKKREVDFVVKLKDKYLPIELKYQPRVRASDSFGIIDLQKGGKSHKGIIITKDTWAERRTHFEIPASVFLLLT